MYEDEIYKRIVKTPDDIIGMLAFALFKEEKFEHLRNIQNDKTMQNISIDEILLHFYKGYNDARIENLYLKASNFFESILENYSERLTDEVLNKIYEEHFDIMENIIKKRTDIIEYSIKDKTDIIKNIIETRTKPKPFWYGASQGIVGSFAFMLILAGILLVSSLIQQKQSYTFSIGVNGLNEVQKTEQQKTDSIKVESPTEQSK